MDLVVRKDGKWYLYDYKSDVIGGKPISGVEKNWQNALSITGSRWNSIVRFCWIILILI